MFKKIILRDLTVPVASRKERYAICGPYQITPNDRIQKDDQVATYQNRFNQTDPIFRLRLERADEVVDLRHTGWFIDEFCDETYHGIVARLPGSRGFLAGWSMGEGMITVLERYIYEDIEDAAHAADSIAENAAENERLYQEEESTDLAA